MDATATLFAQSLLIGLSIAAPVGQIGVLAIQRTVEHGRAAGLATGLGAAFADAVYGAIGAFGITGLIAVLVGLKPWLSGFGALFLVVLAWRIARQPVRPRSGHTAPDALLRYLGSTFLLTLSNPTTILSFLAIFGTLARQVAPGNAASPWAMVGGVLVGSALWWLVLSTGVGLLRDRFDARWQRAVNFVSAGVLAAFAAWQAVSLLAALHSG